MRPALRNTIAILFSLLVVVGWGFQYKLQQRREQRHRVASLPSFTALSLQGAPVANPVGATQPLVIIYFEPDCDHCQRQATEVTRHVAELGSVPVLWLSCDSLPALRQFAASYGLSQLPTMQVMQIRPVVAKKLDFFMTPDIRMYDAERRLLGRYRGEASVAAIERKLREAK